MKTPVNPMRPTYRLNQAPRCTAHAKRTGCPCNGPAMRGWTVCRMHGARGGAPFGPANGRWKDGARSKEIEALRAETRELVQEARDFAAMLGRM